MKPHPEKSRTPWIRPLPERVVNKIAAGEVVERPAAAVKELVENAMDAGAERIEIIIEGSGVKLIKIVDNGCGIPEEQVEVAFGRHATSKISAFDDLENLYTFGFRGEALPSIASVARLRMVSRPSGQDVGTEVIYEGGVLQSRQPIAAPPGTCVEVENLFYNTPARRKFLKSEATEARHISRIATALAIGRADVGFSYTLNGRNIFALPPGQSLGERVAGILGGKTFVDVSGEYGPVSMTGFVGAPDMTQNNRNGQYIFVNSRFIYSPVLSHAIAAGFGELLPAGRFPIGALLVTVDPSEVDVNVHPSKTEVRLSHERDVHEAIRKLIKEALRQDGIIPAFHRPEDSGGASGGPSRGAGPDNRIPGIGGGDTANVDFVRELYRQSDPAPLRPDTAPPRVDRETGEILEDHEHRSDAAGGQDAAPGPSVGFRLVGRFSDLYLLLQAGEDLYIVDQHTAHERVLYEEMLRRVDEQSINGQNLLFPAQVELSPIQLAVFDESLEILNHSGFTVSHFGGRTVNIEAVPAVMAKRAPEKLLVKVLDDIGSLRKGGYDLKKAMAQSIACRSAVMAGDRLNDDEAVHLLRMLLECRDKYSCPHGRPTFIKISRSDLDKQFGRG